MLDIPGFNYRTKCYVEAYEKLPQNMILGSETASTVSSRGVYKFPVEAKADALYDDHQSSSYDLEFCSWSNIPDEDFALADDYDWTLGQFVWKLFTNNLIFIIMKTTRLFLVIALSAVFGFTRYQPCK